MNHKINILKNFLTTYLIKRHYFLMLLIVPYLTSRIGVEQFGMLEFAKSLCYYFTMFVCFGFNYISTQKIMFHIDDSEEVSKIFSATYLIKFLLAVISIPILMCCLYYMQSLRDIKFVVVMFWCVAIASSFTPVFLYQGMNKMPHMVVIDGCCRILFIILLFSFIKKPQDSWMYPTFYAVTDILRTMIALTWAILKFNIKFEIPNFEYIRAIYRPSTSMFLVTLSRTMYERFPQFILGITMGRESVGLYVIGTRVIGEINLAIQQFMQAIYPNIANLMLKNIAEALKILKNILIFSGGVVLLSCFLCYTYSEAIVYFLSTSHNSESAEVLRIASFIPICVYIYNFVGNSFLVPFGKRKVFSYTLVFISIITTLVFALFRYNLTTKKIVNTILIMESLTLLTILFLAIPNIKKVFLKSK